MNLFKPRAVQNSLWPALAIIWIFGWTSSKVKRVWRILYAIMLTVIMMYVNMYGVAIKILLENQTLGWILLFATYFKFPAFFCTIWLWELKGFRAVENAIVELEKLDEELRNFAVIINHKKFVWKQLSIIGGFVILHLTVSVTQQFAHSDSFEARILQDSYTYLSFTLSINMQPFQSLMANLIFTMILEALRIRFKLVNEDFKRIAESDDRIKVKVFTTSHSRILGISGEEIQDRHGNRFDDKASSISCQSVVILTMENTSILRVKKSLGFYRGLVWSFGVPYLRVWYIWRFMYTLILSLLSFAMYGITIRNLLVLTSSAKTRDIGVVLSTILFACTFSYVIMIVWLRKGPRIVQETVEDLAKVDIAMRDFEIVQKNFNLRWGHVLLIGSFLLSCLTDMMANIMLNDTIPDIMPKEVINPHIVFQWSTSAVSRLQILTFDILFSAIISAISYRFQRINMVLYKMGNIIPTKNFRPHKRATYVVSCNDRSRTAKYLVDKLVSELDVLWEMHRRLRYMTDKFCSFFSLPVLVAFLAGLTSSLTAVFFMSAMVHMNFQNSYLVLSFYGFILLCNIARFWTVVRCCNDLVTEANKFGIMLHRINVPGVNFYQKLRELSMKQYQEKLEIVACGVLPIGYSLMALSFFIITAYLVLIFQLTTFPQDHFSFE